MSAHGVAVLRGDVLCTADGLWTRRGGIRSWEDAAAAAGELGAGTVYVWSVWSVWMQEMSTSGPLELPAEAEVTGEGSGTVWRFKLGGVAFVMLSADRARQAGDWGGLSAAELVEAFAAFEKLTGCAWGSSVGQTAEALIVKSHPVERGGVQLDRGPGFVPAPAEDPALEMPFNWRRPLTAGEGRMRYVHAFDLNAQYLAAWIGVQTGHGQPVHKLGTVAFEPGSAGLWRVPSGVLASGLEAMLPAPWTPGRSWFTTPTMARIYELSSGMDLPDITEAWVWPRTTRYLRPAGEKLRGAWLAARAERARAQHALAAAESDAAAAVEVGRVVTADAVLTNVKGLYRVESGRLLMGGRDPASGFARPDWGNAIKALARVNLHRRLSQLGAFPFAIATDGLLFASDVRDGAEFAAAIRLPLGSGLGEFSYDATAELADVLDDPRHDAHGVGGLFETVGDHAVQVNVGA